MQQFPISLRELSVSIFILRVTKHVDLLRFHAATNTTRQKIITNAIADFTAKTCIKFVRYTNQPDYIAITDAEKGTCYSYLGRVGGKQILNLDVPGCEDVQYLFYTRLK
jgi:hypothetical protein